jgi:hypothetical protein
MSQRIRRLGRNRFKPTFFGTGQQLIDNPLAVSGRLHREQVLAGLQSLDLELLAAPNAILAAQFSREYDLTFAGHDGFHNRTIIVLRRQKQWLPAGCGSAPVRFDTGSGPAEITDACNGVFNEVKFFHAALSEQDIAAAMEQ